MHLLRYIFLISLCTVAFTGNAQQGFDLAIKKPEPYENRELKAEKSGRKKFSAPRRFLQNTYTHYNYFFNANNKINEVVTRAKEAHKDDFSKLLPYYNYSLEATKAEEQQLDSVIYKAKTGIVMHDLRNDWIDDLYLLWGQSYLLQQEFDSAYQMFQFINYAFAPKEKDGYYRYIGSRMDGGNARSVVTPEDDRFLKRLTTDPPSRNNAFIWQARTLVESNAYGEAGSLLNTLRQDVAFPARLLPHLEEIQGYLYYKQEMWDSAAHHLVLALDNAANRQERARWEFLAAQLLERTGSNEKAAALYTAAIDHTIDPVLDVWARLNLVRINKEGGDDYISKNIAELDKMARREKYIDYRDVIYGMMARMELERGNFAAAQAYMLKASKYVAENPIARNTTYLNLADFLYGQKQYLQAASYYDSLDVAQLADSTQIRITNRQGHLKELVAGAATIGRQDSLQALAALPEPQRTDALRKLARQIRKQRGIKEEEGSSRANTNRDVRDAAALTSMFQDDKGKGDWYFYNASSRTAGAATFKQVWGNRPNTDNWRRASSAVAELRQEVVNNTRENPAPLADPLAGASITAETLLQTLPTTPEQLRKSNDSIKGALISNGLVYLNEIEDYPSAIATFEELRRRFPDATEMSEVLFRLQYAYSKLGRADSAGVVKQQLLQQFPSSTQAEMARTGKMTSNDGPSAGTTKAYEAVYDLFLEGRFAEAKRAKIIADSTFHTNYWNPQLLFIEAVYHIKQQEDTTAIAGLNLIVEQQGGDSPIGKKAATLIDVLGRRAEIEAELRSLQLDMPVDEKPAVAAAPVKKDEPVTPQPKPEVPPVAKVEPPVQVPPVKAEEKKETPVQQEASKPAPPVVKKEEVKPVVTTVPKAIEQAKPPVKQEAAQQPPPEQQLPKVRRDTTAARQTPVKDVASGNKNNTQSITDQVAKAPIALPKQTTEGYNFQADAAHYAVVVLNKVDNIYGNEARNAFNRYNRDKSSAPAAVQLLPLDGEYKLLLIGVFTDVLGAINYVQEIKPIAGSQVVPWLKADKYSFTVISERNLELLKATPDLKGYLKFLEGTPVKL